MVAERRGTSCKPLLWSPASLLPLLRGRRDPGTARLPACVVQLSASRAWRNQDSSNLRDGAGAQAPRGEIDDAAAFWRGSSSPPPPHSTPPLAAGLSDGPSFIDPGPWEPISLPLVQTHTRCLQITFLWFVDFKSNLLPGLSRLDFREVTLS